MRRVLSSCIAVAVLATGGPWIAVAATEETLASEGATTSASPGGVSGVVKSAQGAPIAGAAVRLLGTTRNVRTDSAGSFLFDRLPPAEYLLEVESGRHGVNAAVVTVTAGSIVPVEIVLDLSVHSEEIVVTASPEAAALSGLAQPVGVLAGVDLAASSRASLGETLATQPGVSSTSFGAGASRPVIRGQGGNRVRILENGVSSGDASDTSPDHAVAIEPLGARKIEIVRGPATLLYGSNAIGGVVNVLDDRIPDHLPAKSVEGLVSLVAATNASEATAAAELGGALGRVAWQASAFRRTTDDYESGEGLVSNSDLEGDGAGLGLSYVTDRGFVGISGRRFDSNYGNPAEEGVRIDLQQRRYDLRAGTERRFGVFNGFDLRFGYNDYEHVELEGSEIGTRFVNDSWETRLDASHRPIGPPSIRIRGSLGIQAASREFAALGEEAFVPPTQADSWAAFIFEEVGSGPVRGKIGVRHERQDAKAVGRPGRHFSGTSASLGGLWQATDALDVALTVARAIKIPDPEQLYANGPHIATGVFEIGEPDLDTETTLGVDLGLRHSMGRVRSEVSVFANRIDDYIFDSFTGEVVGGGAGDDGDDGDSEEPLPVVRFIQADAEFVGGEAQAHIELMHDEPHHWELELGADIVRAKLRDSGEPLPRITPSRLSAGLRYQGRHLSASLFVRRTQQQNRVASFETTTAGFTLFDGAIAYRLFRGDLVHELVLAGSNLTDELARNHISYLKDLAPQPGRDLRLTYRLIF